MPEHTKNIQIAKRVLDGAKRGGGACGSSVAFECDGCCCCCAWVKLLIKLSIEIIAAS